MLFEQITTGGCQSYLLGCPTTRCAVLIDPELSRMNEYRGRLGQLGLHVLGTPKAPDDGGTLHLTTRRGELATVAALPFLSQRYAVRAAELLLHENAQHALDYARRVAAMIGALTEQFGPDVNIVMDESVAAKGEEKVSARFMNTPVDTAVRVLVDRHGFTSLRMDNVIYVTSREKAAKLREDIEKEKKLQRQMSLAD